MDIKAKIIAGYELKAQFERIVYVNTGTTGTSIDDTTISSYKTWSSQKISDELSTKADTTHTHTTSDMTDFNSVVDGKISAHNTDTNAHTDIRNAINSKPDIDDTTSSTSTVYSSQKVEDRLSTKADATHTHALNDLSDVDTTGATNGQVLTFDSTSGLWIPSTISGGGSGTAGLTLIADIKITNTSERTSAIDITGLDLATDEEYLIFFSFTWNELNYQSGLLYFNNDFTDTNYFYHFGYSSTAGGTVQSGNGTKIIRFPNAWGYDYTGFIILKKPEHYSAVLQCFNVNPTFSEETRSYVTWKVTGQNVTTLNFRTTSTVTDFYKEPSRIKIYKVRG